MMKTYIYLISFLAAVFSLQMQAQTADPQGVGLGVDPHARAVLDTHIPGSTATGVILARVATEEDLPMYNHDWREDGSGTGRKYLADDTMAGMLVYVDELKTYLQYDGRSWTKVGNAPFYMYPNATFLGTSRSNGYGVVAGINIGNGNVNFNRGLNNDVNDYSDGFFNGLDITTGMSATDGFLIFQGYDVTYYQIAEAGFYNISYCLRINGGGANILGDFFSTVYFEGQFLQTATEYSDWTIMDIGVVHPVIILGVTVGVMDISKTITAYFRAGDRFRLHWKPSSTSVLSGSGWGNSTSSSLTNLLIEKVN